MHLLSGSLEDLARKSRFEGRFDCVYVSNTCTHFMSPAKRAEFTKLLSKKRALVVCETALHMARRRRYLMGTRYGGEKRGIRY